MTATIAERLLAKVYDLGNDIANAVSVETHVTPTPIPAPTHDEWGFTLALLEKYSGKGFRVTRPYAVVGRGTGKQTHARVVYFYNAKLHKTNRRAGYMLPGADRLMSTTRFYKAFSYHVSA